MITLKINYGSIHNPIARKKNHVNIERLKSLIPTTGIEKLSSKLFHLPISVTFPVNFTNPRVKLNSFRCTGAL